MKKIYVIFLVFLVHVFQAVSLRADNLIYNLIVLLNHDQSELKSPLNSDHIAITGTLAIALHEKANPILVSTSLKENFDRHFNDPDNQKIVALIRANNLSEPAFRARPEYATATYAYTYPLMAYNPTEWFIYKNKLSDLLLFIPKTYAAQKELEYADKKQEQENLKKELQDKFDTAKAVYEKLTEEKEDTHQKLEEINYFNSELQRIDTILKNQKQLEDAANTGNYEEIQSKKVLLACGFDRRAFTTVDAKAPYTKPKTQTTIRGAIQLSLLTKEQTFGEWLIYLSGHGYTAMTKSHKLDPETAIIADLKFRDFIGLLTHLNKNTNTLALFYLTCFAGGYNRGFIEAAMRQIMVNYYLISVGASDKTVGASQPTEFEITDAKEVIIKPKISFDQYFKNLTVFFTKPTPTITDIKTKTDKIRQEEDEQTTYNFLGRSLNPDEPEEPTKATAPVMLSDPFSKNLAPLLPEDQIRSSNLQVFVRFPGSDKLFTPLHLNNQKIKFLTKTKLEALRLSVLPTEYHLDYSNTDLVFIDTDTVLHKLELGKDTAIAYSKKSFDQNQNRTLFIAECAANTTLNQFLYNLAQFFGPHETKIYIKSLQAMTNLYSNIQIEGTIPGTIKLRYTNNNYIPYYGQVTITPAHAYKPDAVKKLISATAYVIDISPEYMSSEKFNTVTKIDQYSSGSETLVDFNNQIETLEKLPYVEAKTVALLKADIAMATKQRKISSFDRFLLFERIADLKKQALIIASTEAIKILPEVLKNIDINRTDQLNNFLAMLVVETTAGNIPAELGNILKINAEKVLKESTDALQRIESKIVTGRISSLDKFNREFTRIKNMKNSLGENILDKYQIARLLFIIAKSYDTWLDQFGSFNDYYDYFEYFCISLNDAFTAGALPEAEYTDYLSRAKKLFIDAFADMQPEQLTEFFNPNPGDLGMQEFIATITTIHKKLALCNQPMNRFESDILTDELRNNIPDAAWLTLKNISFHALQDEERIKTVSANIQIATSNKYITEKDSKEIIDTFEKLQKFAQDFKGKISIPVKPPQEMLKYFEELKTTTKLDYETAFGTEKYELEKNCLDLIERNIKKLKQTVAQQAKAAEDLAIPVDLAPPPLVRQ